MPLPLIVSLPRRIKGLETLSHFVIIDGNTDGGYRCLGPDCGTYLWDRLSPVELADGGEIDQDETGDCSPLCRPCSFRTSARIAAGSGWSGLETSDISALWRLVSAEQARDSDVASVILRGKTDTQIRTEIREAREKLRILESALDARDRASAPLASVLPGGRVISGGRQ